MSIFRRTAAAAQILGGLIGTVWGGGLGLVFGVNHHYVVDPSQFTFGVAPQPGGGAVLGVGLRF